MLLGLPQTRRDMVIVTHLNIGNYLTRESTTLYRSPQCKTRSSTAWSGHSTLICLLPRPLTTWSSPSHQVKSTRVAWSGSSTLILLVARDLTTRSGAARSGSSTLILPGAQAPNHLECSALILLVPQALTTRSGGTRSSSTASSAIFVPSLPRLPWNTFKNLYITHTLSTRLFSKGTDLRPIMRVGSRRLATSPGIVLSLLP
jgi:hypothetical protein